MDRTDVSPTDFLPRSSCAEIRRTTQTRKAAARKVSGRRRLIDPATCDRDYSAGELEFMGAIHQYKQSSGRKFPTWSEVLEVLRGLGYAKAGG